MSFEFEFKCHWYVCKIVLLSLNMAEEGEKQQFEINCACHGFHGYRNVWIPKLKQILQVKQELGYVHDPSCYISWNKNPWKTN